MDTSNKNKIILDLCAGTGSWSKPYRDAGYDVRVITLPENDIRTYEPPKNVYGILAAPPCENFSRAIAQKKELRRYDTGIEVMSACLNIIWRVQNEGTPLKFWALENPNGRMHMFLGFPYMSFQPWQFGEMDFRATKRTWLWGYFKKPTMTVKERDFDAIPRVSPHSRPSDNSPFDRDRKNTGFLKASREKRAETSYHFAKAFFEANQ